MNYYSQKLFFYKVHYAKLSKYILYNICLLIFIKSNYVNLMLKKSVLYTKLNNYFVEMLD